MTKQKNYLFLSAVLLASLISGCRSKPNDNKTPSTTTVPTTMATTQSTQAPADTTQPSGNGPIDSTTGETTLPDSADTTQATSGADTSRSMPSGTGRTGSFGNMG